MARRLLTFLLILASASCAFPRRSTSLSPAQSPRSAPPDVYRIQFTGATVTPRQRSGQRWDEDGSGPDPYLRLYRGEELVFESAKRPDTLQPRWESAVTENLLLPRTTPIRVELWDAEPIPTPIGIFRGRGLPGSALPDADASVTLDGGSLVTFRVQQPEAHRGTGIELYEVRGSELRVVKVISHSPAGRAGIRGGDAIVAIGGSSVEDLGEARAASQLSMAGSRSETLTVRRSDGSREDLTLDGGYVWRAR